MPCVPIVGALWDNKMGRELSLAYGVNKTRRRQKGKKKRKRTNVRSIFHKRQTHLWHLCGAPGLSRGNREH